MPQIHTQSMDVDKDSDQRLASLGKSAFVLKWGFAHML